MATGGETVRAWRPPVPGISEVFHARFTEHAYPLHTHDAWTVLIIDDGVVTYDLGRRQHGALRPTVTLLPPQVAHDGRSARSGGFRKRVIYLEPELIGPELIGAAVDQPEFADRLLRRRIDQLHTAVESAGDELEAQSRLMLITERLRWHLTNRRQDEHRLLDPHRRSQLAAELRDLLDEHLVDGLDLQHAAALLGTGETQLIRSFTHSYGLPPHRYLTGRRVERARKLLLDGHPPAEAATAAGFYDQAHLTRHLRRMIGTTPGRYRSG